MDETPATTQIRLAELMAALSLALDLGTGQPLEHELGICLSALDLAERVGCPPAERSAVYYVALLAHLGCSAVAPDLARWVGGDEIHFQSDAQVLGPAADPTDVVRHLVRRVADDRPAPERVRLVVKNLTQGNHLVETMGANLCDGAPLLAQRLRLPELVVTSLGQLLERWDGQGVPRRLSGDQIARPQRIVRVAHDLVAVAHARGSQAALDTLARRRGRGYDPDIVDAALADPQPLLRAAAAPDAWERVIALEPQPVATIPRLGLASVAQAIGDFVDLKVWFLHGHSSRVAALAARAATAVGGSSSDVADVRVAGFVHDLGRMSVPNGIWDKAGPLTARDWERVRLHTYYTERILEHTQVLGPVAIMCGSHHERLDGSGYHRGATAGHLDPGTRLLAVADACDAMTHDRPYRAALSPEQARSELGTMVRTGALDKRAVAAVLDVAGMPPTRARQGYPAGLTEREVEVVRLLAQGRTNRDIAETLVIAAKTVDHHVQHIYTKVGVSTRVGAALFAMQHDLIE